MFDPAGKKERKSDCGEWQWSVCVANEGDCGLGTREGTRTGTDCKQTIKTQRCKIPCNWKKKFGGEGGCWYSLDVFLLAPISPIDVHPPFIHANNGPNVSESASSLEVQHERLARTSSQKNINNHPALSLAFRILDCATFAGGMSFSDMPQGLLFPQ